MRLRRKIRWFALQPGFLIAVVFAASPALAAPPRFPMRISTPPLIVTGDATTPPRFPSGIATSPLIVTGEATTPPKFSSHIATPALVVTGTAP